MNCRLASLLVFSGLIFSMEKLAIAQNKDEKSLYELSLAAYIEAKAQQGGSGNSTIVLSNCVLNDSHVIETFPTKIGQSTIEYLNEEAIIERFKKLGKEFTVVAILPMRNRDGLLRVGCAEYRAGVRHRKLVLGVFGGYDIHWRIDCSKNQYVKVKVEKWSPLTL
jgi:hypothetical protein